MSGGRFAKKERDNNEPTYPKLNASHLKEITELVIKYGGMNRVLKHWQAVKLDENDRIISICDFTDFYNKDDYNKNKYEKFEPLKGIKYLGMGFVTYMPFNWCKEWMSTWSVWIVEEANRGDIQAQAMVRSDSFKRIPLK